MIVISFIVLRRMGSKVVIMHNPAESWFAGLSRVLRSLVNKQVKGDGVGSCRGLIGPKIKYFTQGPKKRVQKQSCVSRTVHPSCDRDDCSYGKLIVPINYDHRTRGLSKSRSVSPSLNYSPVSKNVE